MTFPAHTPPPTPDRIVEPGLASARKPSHRWRAANPDAPDSECPDAEMDTVILLVATVCRPSRLTPPQTWPRAVRLLGEIARMPEVKMFEGLDAPTDPPQGG